MVVHHVPRRATSVDVGIGDRSFLNTELNRIESSRGFEKRQRQRQRQTEEEASLRIQGYGGELVLAVMVDQGQRGTYTTMIKCRIKSEE